LQRLRQNRHWIPGWHTPVLAIRRDRLREETGAFGHQPARPH
jgi:hypothetical protein